MSIANVINSIQTHLTSAYTSLTNKGATIPTNKNINNLASAINSIPSGGTYQAKTVTPTTSQQNVTPDNGYDALSSVTVNGVTNAIDSNIQAGNIKSGVSILGVSGTYNNSNEKLDEVLGNTIETFVSNSSLAKEYTFYNATYLQSATLPNATIIGVACFRGCGSLSTVDLGSVTSIQGNAFRNSNLSSLTIRTNSVATLADTTALQGTNLSAGFGNIFVPANLVDSYKSATTWSNYAGIITAIVE